MANVRTKFKVAQHFCFNRNNEKMQKSIDECSIYRLETFYTGWAAVETPGEHFACRPTVNKRTILKLGFPTL